ncbi:MAG TPA: cytochrome d ubiquinol oxidase subunit II [Solirubrobacteraceae bacterium]
MTSAELVAIVLWVAAMLYAVFGGADFGAGVWDLLAGGARSGARPRALIDRALTPVWEANHVWLIFLLVIMWTAFPTAFAAITTTLFVPLTLAALGIVLRGSGFAFRKVVEGLGGRRAFGAIFASSSLITPFFLGAAVGAIVSGDVHVGGPVAGASTWLSLISVTIGVLFVATSSHVASVFLVAEARRAGDGELERYFRRRAIASGAISGLLALAGLLVVHRDARLLYEGLTSGAGLALVIISSACGLATLALLVAGRPAPRVIAVGAVAAIVWGWGAAQAPYLLPATLKINAAAAPGPTLTALFVVFGAALLIVVPALVLLLALSQRGLLGEGGEGG